MDQLNDVLQKATAAVPQSYFQLKIDSGDPIYRERVYCYELYHQMRCVWPETEFYLNGEIDKAAHPILAQLGVAAVKPDFLVHKPGYMDGNHAIIEVKTSLVDNAGIQKDLNTLSTFVRDVRYERAIFLVFGSGADQKMADQIAHIASTVEGLSEIDVWFHDAPGQSAYCKMTLS